MKRILLLSAVLFCLISNVAWAQRTVSGSVTEDNGSTIPGVNVVLKGTSNGTTTDIDGTYRLSIPEEGGTLVFSFIGLATQEVEVGARSVVNVTMESDVQQLTEVVVTALGIDRDKASLGYATQEVGGEEVSRVKDVNFMNSLSGKVAGVQIKRSNQMGGSTNIVVRGYKSLTGGNQALFVVDGVVMGNDINNSANQQTGRGGYDYGNAAMDINPDDIKSINVLKGAAATALYGSRAANGVIVITTKKGESKKGIGVNVSFGSTFGKIDKSTYVKYQNEYGAGYSSYLGWYAETEGYDYYDFGNGPELTTPTYEDASYGAPLDGTLAYDWRSFYPELSTYGQLLPQLPTDNDATTFFETSKLFNTNVSVQGGNDKANYRLSFTNVDQSGVLPNSKLTRNTVAFAGGYSVTDKLKVSSTVNYVLNEAVGRYGTGYDGLNPNQSFRQWYQVTTDMEEQKAAYEQTGLNISWNPYGALDPGQPTVPHYFDNYYWTRYENYNNDERNRVFGNFKIDYEIADWITFTGRMSTDRYSELREERIAVGSQAVSSYYRQNRNFSEDNLDLFLNFNKNFSESFSLAGVVGANYRKTVRDAIAAQTNGGLVTPGVYSLSNSINNPTAPAESHTEVGVNGYFAQANFGFAQMIYLDLGGRYDIASTLPSGDNSYFYPSASLAFVFSELVNPAGIFDNAKVRFNYAQVGNLAPALLVNDIYILNTPFNGVPLATASNTRRNPTLQSERTQNLEAGLEAALFNNRLGLDFTLYQANSFDQIFQTDVTAATGRRVDVVNAGEIQNKGVELTLRGTPIKTGDFTWNVNVNWTKNVNEVISLYGDQTNLQLSTAQGGISLNATVGEPFGTIRGTNYQFDDQGRPIVYAHPYGGVRFRKTTAPEVIGDINPDWLGGVQNTLTYKGVSLSFLIDVQKGGNFFSLDTWYGYATGIYDLTAGTNREGNPRRDLPGDGGGIYLDEDELSYLDIDEVVMQATNAEGDYLFDDDGNPIGGEVSDEPFYVSDVYNALGYAIAPNSVHIYDASFVKLRELSVSYAFPKSFVDNTPFEAINLSLVGRNLWIIHKNSPYSDPESGLSAGNNLGNQSGAYPAVREFGFNLGLKF